MLKKILCRLSEFLLIIALFVVLTIGITLYRVHSSPLNMGFALETIEQALADEARGLKTSVGHVSLFWPDLKGPVLLLLDQVHILQNGEERFALERAAVSIARLPLLVAKIEPEAVILEGTTVKLIRDIEGNMRVALDLGEKKEGQSVHAVDPFKILEEVLETESQNDPLYGLKAFEIKEASIFVEDQKQQKTWIIPDFSAVFARENGEVSLNVSYGMEEAIVPTDIKINLSRHEREDSFYTGHLHFQNVDVALLGETFGFEPVQGRGLMVQGRASVDLSKEWGVRRADIDLKSGGGQLKIGALYDRFLDIDHINLDLDYDAQTSRVQLRQLDVSAHNVSLTLSSDIDLHKNEIKIPLKITGQEIVVDDLAILWPEALDAEIAKEWVVDNLSVGILTDLSVSIPLSFARDETHPWTLSVGEVESAFAFENMSVDYNRPLMPATHVNGHGSFKDDDLRIEGTTGKIKDLTTDKLSVVISDLSVVGGGRADIDVHVDGPLKTLIEYIGHESINLKDELGFEPKEVKGQASLDVQIDFPTVEGLEIEDINVKVDATLTDVYLPNIVKGMPLTGGPLTLEAGNGKFSLKGKGALDGRPLDLTYVRYLELKKAPFVQKVEARLVADKALRDKFDIELEEYVSGDLPLSLVYVEKANKKAKIEVDADLTPVDFFIESLNYKKSIGEKGRVEMSLLLEGETLKEVSDLNITLHDGHIKKGRLVFSKIQGEIDLERAQFPDIKFPDNILSVELEQTQKGTLKIEIGAQKLDVRPYLGKDAAQDFSSKDAGKRTIVSGHVDRLRVSDKGVFEGVKLYLDISQTGDVNQLELDARAGRGDIYLRYKPNALGNLGFRLEAEDAGATLKAMDIYEDMQGGALLIEASRPPKSHKNDLTGLAQITNFKVVNAPTLARLLNAMSLPGLQQLLNSDGVEFEKMKTNFKRKKTGGGTELLFKNGRTSGSEVGLTFEGKVNQDTGFVDIQGTIVPLSTLNKVVGSIPLLGPIITGGTGVLIAATYTMKSAPADKEIKVFVNPLSALTPGILRRILFEGENPADK